jgi:hypothetical protein
MAAMSLKYPMNWNQIYQDMAFNPYKGDMASYRELKDALTTLYCFLQGQARLYELNDALGYLEQRFGSGVLMGCNAIRKSAQIEDEDIRDQLFYEGISLIERYLLRNQGAKF